MRNELLFLIRQVITNAKVKIETEMETSAVGENPTATEKFKIIKHWSPIS